MHVSGSEIALFSRSTKQEPINSNDIVVPHDKRTRKYQICLVLMC